MSFTPEYLKSHLTDGATAYEVQKAAVIGVEIAHKGLTDEQLTLMQIDPEKGGKYYSVKMAGTAIDRHRERFSIPVLQKYADDIEKMGASLNFGHDSKIIIGKVVKAYVDGDNLSGVIWVNDKAVIPSQAAISINEAITTGMVKDVSVEVSGTIRSAEKDNEGYTTVWEYFVDPMRPNSTEFHGLAIVQRGAQIGAGITVKALGENNPKPIGKQIINLNMKEVIVIDGKKHFITGEVENGKIAVDQSSIDAVELAVKQLETKAQEADTHKAANEALKAEIAALRAPFEADIANAEKALNAAAPMSTESIKSLSTVDLIAKANELITKLDTGKKEAESSKSFNLNYQ